MDAADIDALSGRELDMAVARSVFGYEVESLTVKRTGQRDAVCRKPGGQWLRVSYYATGLTSQILLEDALRLRGWIRRPMLVSDPIAPAHVVLDGPDGRAVDAIGRTLGEALARAAVKAGSAEDPAGLSSRTRSAISRPLNPR